MALLKKVFLIGLIGLLVGCGGGGSRSGGSLDGFLSSSDWVLSGNFYADRYIFRVTRNGNVTIDMTSNDFDTYLIVIDENSNVLEDDDSGAGENARLTFQAFAGETLEVRATSHFSQDGGAYRLSWSDGLVLDGELRGTAGSREKLAAPNVKPKAEAAQH